ncbi:hypothetical protein F5Y16DRAFT_401620 [Xylariaceae sp. FL0255]|nr:hypothetical protein F5Y16DRAFT_401620 [Xylariaceae sp. FL0255]
MAPKSPSIFRKAWLQWKALRLPWRKRFLVGLDLQGNTYWEFRLARGDQPPPLSATSNKNLSQTQTPFRRLVHYPRSTHYSEVKVPPAWHQWLRYQREFPPTIQEQTAEVQRQERIKVLAAEADARWEAKDSLLDMPTTTKQAGRIGPAEAKPEMGGDEQVRKEHEVKEEETKQDVNASKPESFSKTAEDPWKRASRGGPSETWQPGAWTPTATKKRWTATKKR